MIQIQKNLIITLLFLGSSYVSADNPVSNFSARLGYEFISAGQNITRSNASSALLVHAGVLTLEPIPYASVAFLLGCQSFKVDEYQSANGNAYHAFQSDYAIGAGGKIALRTPAFFPIALRLAVTTSTFHFLAKEQQYTYDAALVRNHFGMRIAPFDAWSVEMGLATHFLGGEMDNGSGTTRFGNVTRSRPYFSFAFLSPDGRFYSNIYFDLSGDIEGPLDFMMTEATIGLQAGVVLFHDKTKIMYKKYLDSRSVRDARVQQERMMKRVHSRQDTVDNGNDQ